MDFKIKQELIIKNFLNRADIVPLSLGGRPCPATPKSIQRLLDTHLLGKVTPPTTVSYNTAKRSGSEIGHFRTGAYTPVLDKISNKAVSKWMCIDIDGASHADGLEDVDGMLKELVREIKKKNERIPLYFEKSGSGTGWHLWIFFDPDKPAPAQDIRSFGLKIIGNRNVEIFPKQDGENVVLGNMVWLPWWHGANEGGNQFYRQVGNSFEAYEPTSFDYANIEDLKTENEDREEDKTRTPDSLCAMRENIQPEWVSWRNSALEKLDLKAIYGNVLTGAITGDGWLESRDPRSESGDSDPSAGVSDGTGKSERGAFHSFLTGETISVFEYLVKIKKSANSFNEALKQVSLLSGTPLPGDTLPKKSEKKQKSTNSDIFGNSDIGNAKLFTMMHKNEARFCLEWKKWIIWQNQRWVTDEMPLQLKAEETISELIKKTKNDENNQGSANIRRVTSVNGLSAMLKIAVNQPGIPINANSIDADKTMILSKNVLINTETGATRKPEKEDFMMHMVPHNHNPGAECVNWLKFLDTVTNSDEELIEYIKRAVGYSLTGEISEQCLFILYGKGRNGKTTFVNALHDVLGDQYSKRMRAETLMQNKNRDQTNDLARLTGVRFVSASETKEGGRIDEGMVKAITGGEAITARFLYSEFFEFIPQFKLWLTTNHKPEIRGTDDGIWRRLRMIPFTVKIPEDKIDKNLQKKLKAEAEGIFQWALEGARIWHEKGLNNPLSIQCAQEEYKEEMDTLGQFIEDCCENEPETKEYKSEEKYIAKCREIYRSYTMWSRNIGQREVSMRRFSQWMNDKGYRKSNRTSSGYYWFGIRLLSHYGEAVESN